MMVEIQFSFRIQCLQSDNGGEFKLSLLILPLMRLHIDVLVPTLLNKMAELSER